ncbi:AraC family transcriptional regulator [Paenibacillus sp. LHD-38]|uniref:helix-turn-helix domain-containing protein n=1 Tax=Paenibacillus sp. LHD-38 TaxID=3072143 RepID=UPI00280DF590|nr:AraC family transcriptional regulator [Paenibacillus sp. LHD-38]MDQ8734999.1 AraC family transcriptional regulator [Paenibacillus sp. LHD-38]
MVRERYAQGITLEESAAALNITPEYLSTLVNKETGKTFTAHLKEMRISRAKELLLAGELKAFEVSIRVGYADSKYFCRVFKEHTGMTPVEYQKKN